jgi:hypothetical protein
MRSLACCQHAIPAVPSMLVTLIAARYLYTGSHRIATGMLPGYQYAFVLQFVTPYSIYCSMLYRPFVRIKYLTASLWHGEAPCWKDGGLHPLFGP